MSQILEEAVQAGDPQRVAELARNDAEREAEAERIAADLARNVDKGARLARLNDLHAQDLQLQYQGYIGALS
jgi:hypothetical protein